LVFSDFCGYTGFSPPKKKRRGGQGVEDFAGAWEVEFIQIEHDKVPNRYKVTNGEGAGCIVAISVIVFFVF
jgi:hypothetical protein